MLWKELSSSEIQQLIHMNKSLAMQWLNINSPSEFQNKKVNGIQREGPKKGMYGYHQYTIDSTKFFFVKITQPVLVFWVLSNIVSIMSLIYGNLQ